MVIATKVEPALHTDPTELTTELIHHEISAVGENVDALRTHIREDLAARAEVRQREQLFQEKIFDAKLDAIEREYKTKIDSINEATLLRLEIINRFPEDIKTAVGHHEELQKERFAAIQQQFNERDIRTQQAQEASAQALAAALQAAKELVGAQGEASAAAAVKSETSFTKQIDQIGTIIQTLEKALDARITELKERIDRGEGNIAGTTSTQSQADAIAAALVQAGLNNRNEKREGNSQMIALGVAALLFISLMVTIVGLVLKK